MGGPVRGPVRPCQGNSRCPDNCNRARCCPLCATCCRTVSDSRHMCVKVASQVTVTAAIWTQHGYTIMGMNGKADAISGVGRAYRNLAKPRAGVHSNLSGAMRMRCERCVSSWGSLAPSRFLSNVEIKFVGSNLWSSVVVWMTCC